MKVFPIILKENFIYSIFSNKKMKLNEILVLLEIKLEQAFFNNDYVFITEFTSYSYEKIQHLFRDYEDFSQNSNLYDIFFKLYRDYELRLKNKWFDSLDENDTAFFNFLKISSSEYINIMYPRKGIKVPYSEIISRLLWNGEYNPDNKLKNNYHKEYLVAKKHLDNFTSNY